NQCSAISAQCSNQFWSWITSTPTQELLTPVSTVAPVEPGSWRIEESPSTAQNQDYFLNVMLATDAADTNVPATVTDASNASSIGATWSDSVNTYTVTFSRTGAGGHITVV